jgi:L-lactate dehydrogenase complex protein LldF
VKRGASPVGFEQRASAALRDSPLRQALDAATERFIAQRASAFRDLPDADALRARARAIKDEVLGRLDDYLRQLADAVRKRGGIVHWARDRSEAREIILDLARARGVKRVVKSKSMVTEEIELNEALEAAGIRPVETDLGEWIVQLAREKPSHIIAPAIHKSRREVAELFSRKVGRPLAPDIELLTATARDQLRQEFLQADMGISGVNFAVAETGTLVLVTNEGNGRMVTSVPPFHLAIMGIEKVIPTLEDLMVFLKILARSATGQKASSYVSLITGVGCDGDSDRPRELHLVILDNGRSRYLSGPFREALYCIRCGACLNVCPVYRQVGGHAYGATYPGPIGIILTSMLEGPGGSKELASASSLCGACQQACPLDIDIPHMLLELRREAVAGKQPSIGERAAFRLMAAILRHDGLYRLAGKVGRLLQRPFVRGKRIARLPFPLSRWTVVRDFPPLSARTFRDRWRTLNGNRSN